MINIFSQTYWIIKWLKYFAPGPWCPPHVNRVIVTRWGDCSSINATDGSALWIQLNWGEQPGAASGYGIKDDKVYSDSLERESQAQWYGSEEMLDRMQKVINDFLKLNLMIYFPNLLKAILFTILSHASSEWLAMINWTQLRLGEMKSSIKLYCYHENQVNGVHWTWTIHKICLIFILRLKSSHLLSLNGLTSQHNADCRLTIIMPVPLISIVIFWYELSSPVVVMVSSE